MKEEYNAWVDAVAHAICQETCAFKGRRRALSPILAKAIVGRVGTASRDKADLLA
jgi:hypothetical protein